MTWSTIECSQQIPFTSFWKTVTTEVPVTRYDTQQIVRVLLYSHFDLYIRFMCIVRSDCELYERDSFWLITEYATDFLRKLWTNTCIHTVYGYCIQIIIYRNLYTRYSVDYQLSISWVESVKRVKRKWKTCRLTQALSVHNIYLHLRKYMHKWGYERIQIGKAPSFFNLALNSVLWFI